VRCIITSHAQVANCVGPYIREGFLAESAQRHDWVGVPRPCHSEVERLRVERAQARSPWLCEFGHDYVTAHPSHTPPEVMLRSGGGAGASSSSVAVGAGASAGGAKQRRHPDSPPLLPPAGEGVGYGQHGGGGGGEAQGLGGALAAHRVVRRQGTSALTVDVIAGSDNAAQSAVPQPTGPLRMASVVNAISPHKPRCQQVLATVSLRAPFLHMLASARLGLALLGAGWLPGSPWPGLHPHVPRYRNSLLSASDRWCAWTAAQPPCGGGA
jgi:hypothetical protein